jgi:cell cycle sensor histidine kinase DivJ
MELEADYDRMKRILIDAAGHELRAPLAGIIGWTDLLLANYFGQLGGEQLVAVQSTRDFAQRSHLLAERTIARARPLDLRVFDLTAAVWQVLEGKDIWINTRRAKGQVSIIFEQIEPLLIQADQGKVELIVTELVTNALKFLNGGRLVTVEIGERGHDVAIAVTDDGVGIKPDFVDRLGQEFQRLYEGDDHKYLGWGTGLAMVYELAQAHGGRVEVESEVGEGSTFTVYFPRR